MSKKVSTEKLKIEYEKNESLITSAANEINKALEALIEKHEISTVFPLKGRVKKFDSILEKISSGTFVPKKSIFEFQDLIGYRIILMLKSDFEKVSSLLTSVFNVVRHYEPENRLEEDQFGYSSLHLVLHLKESWKSVPQYEDLTEILFEVQIRTLSQHIWAETSHKLEYKLSSKDKLFKRDLARMAALLEYVDIEISRLFAFPFGDSKSSEQELDKEISASILEEFLDQNLPKNFKLGNEDYAKTARILNDNNYSVEKLKTLIQKHLKEAIVIDDELIRKSKSSTEEFFYWKNAKYTKIKNPSSRKTFHNQVGLLSLIIKLSNEES